MAHALLLVPILALLACNRPADLSPNADTTQEQPGVAAERPVASPSPSPRPAPSPSIARLAEIDAEIERIEKSLSQNDLQDRRSEIMQSIREEQANVARLQSSLEAQRSVAGARETNERLLVEQRNRIWDPEIQEARERVRQQEARVAEIRARMQSFTIGTEDTDLARSFANQISAAQQRLVDLQSQYDDLLLARNLAIQQNAAERTQDVQGQQAGIADMQFQEDMSQVEIERLNRELQQAQESQQQQQERLQALRNERRALAGAQ